MQIVNESQLLDNAHSENIRRLRRDALNILKTAVDEAEPKRSILRRLELGGSILRFGSTELDLDEFSKIYVVGGGKACGAMGEAIEELLGKRVFKGILNVLQGTECFYNLKRIELYGASHPIPDEQGVQGTGVMLDLVDQAKEDDLVIVLISGGGSALMTYPAESVSLESLKGMTELLLKSGATINDLNTVRKHLSAVSGGWLARRAYPATILSLILSDVVGDPLDIIASGPTAPDHSTFRDARDVLIGYGIWDKVARAVRRRLDSGSKGEIEETPKPGDKIFEKVFNIVVCSNIDAVRAATKKASEIGYNALIISTRIEGEARHVGTVYAGIANEIIASGNPINRPAAIVAGGETTVTVLGTGRGGRNQELALSASMRLNGQDAVIATLATDGIDGSTDAAGAIVDSWTVKRAQIMGLSPISSLRDNDSHAFFSRLGDAIITKPTGTNVNDLAVILVSG